MSNILNCIFGPLVFNLNSWYLPHYFLYHISRLSYTICIPHTIPGMRRSPRKQQNAASASLKPSDLLKPARADPTRGASAAAKWQPPKPADLSELHIQVRDSACIRLCHILFLWVLGNIEVVTVAKENTLDLNLTIFSEISGSSCRCFCYRRRRHEKLTLQGMKT